MKQVPNQWWHDSALATSLSRKHIDLPANIPEFVFSHFFVASGDLHGKSQGSASKKKLEHIQKDSERFRKLIRWKAKLRRRQRKAMSPMPFLRSPSATFTVSVSMNLFVNLWWTGRALAKERFEASANQTKVFARVFKAQGPKILMKKLKKKVACKRILEKRMISLIDLCALFTWSSRAWAAEIESHVAGH